MVIAKSDRPYAVHQCSAGSRRHTLIHENATVFMVTQPSTCHGQRAAAFLEALLIRASHLLAHYARNVIRH